MAPQTPDGSPPFSFEPPALTSEPPPYSDNSKTRLSAIASKLAAGETVTPITVRAFLTWFWGSQRRGRFIVSYIREQLAKAGLTTVPDFESTYLDAEMAFALVKGQEPVVPANSAKVGETIAIADHVEVKVSPAISADPTYRISKLAAANRRPVSVKPDSCLSEAITLMMANDFSQLPVMVNEREVKGTVSWKSIGTRLALGQAPKYVREAMDPHVEITSEASLFTAIPIIVEHEYALVRSADKANRWSNHNQRPELAVSTALRAVLAARRNREPYSQDNRSSIHNRTTGRGERPCR